MEILFILENSWLNYIGNQRKSSKNETPYCRLRFEMITLNKHASLPFQERKCRVPTGHVANMFVMFYGCFTSR